MTASKLAKAYMALPMPITQATPRGHPLEPLNSSIKLASLYSSHMASIVTVTAMKATIESPRQNCVHFPR